MDAAHSALAEFALPLTLPLMAAAGCSNPHTTPNYRRELDLGLLWCSFGVRQPTEVVSRIGTRNGWAEFLQEKKAQFKGNRLVRIR